jgi:hypothetical protein
MQVTIVHTSDDNARVHKAGCAYITRTDQRRRDYLSSHTIEVTSQQAAAEDAWGDFVAEESMTEADALAYTRFLPCCDGLPEQEPEADIPAEAQQSWMRTRGDGVTYHRTDNGQNARCRRELVAYGAVLTDAEMDKMVATVAHTHRCTNCQADQAIELAAEGGSGFAPGQPYYEIYPVSGPQAYSTKRNPTCVNQGTAEHNAREYSRDGRAYVVELVDADGKRSKVAEFRNGRKVRRA